MSDSKISSGHHLPTPQFWLCDSKRPSWYKHMHPSRDRLLGLHQVRVCLTQAVFSVLPQEVSSSQAWAPPPSFRQISCRPWVDLKIPQEIWPENQFQKPKKKKK